MKTGGCIIHKITRSEEYQKREVGARGELDCESRHSWPHSGDARTYTFEIEAWAGPLPTRLLKENPRHITTLSLSETWCACLWGHASYAITFGISINVPVSIVCVRLQVANNQRAGLDHKRLATRVQERPSGSALLYRSAVELRTRPLQEAGVHTLTALRSGTYMPSKSCNKYWYLKYLLLLLL